MPDEHDSFDRGTCRDDIAIVDLEPHKLHVMLNVAREKELDALELFWKQVQFVAPINVPRDLLPIVSNIADGLFPIDHTGYCVAPPVRGLNNGGPLVKGDVFQAKRDAVLFKDMSHGDAERRPRKLDEREHGSYMTEAERKFNSGGMSERNWRFESVTASWAVFWLSEKESTEVASAGPWTLKCRQNQRRSVLTKPAAARS